MVAKALIGNENNEWELRKATKNDEDESYTVGGRRDYLPKPDSHIGTLKLKTAFGYKRYTFFVAHVESPIPISITKRQPLNAIDTSSAVHTFRRAHIAQAIGRAARQLPGNDKTKMLQIAGIAGLALLGLVLYYSGAIDGIIGWLTGAK